MMDSWHSYPSIYALGHAAVADLLDGPVLVEEKIDGSQFSFGVDEEENWHFRSKKAEIIQTTPPKMFAQAVRYVQRLSLHRGWTYRGEVLDKPKHNGLAYGRVPRCNVIVFDINTGLETYLGYEEKRQEVLRIGLEVVPLLGTWTNEKLLTLEALRMLLDTDSVLGGTKVEGVVIKPASYDVFGKDKKVLMGKYVSEAYKEVQKAAWKQNNPSGRDIAESIAGAYSGPARWQKAIIHLREQGLIEGSPRDIGALLKEVNQDVLKECKEEMMKELWRWAWPHIGRKITAGLPAWYKEQLLEKQFEGGQGD